MQIQKLDSILLERKPALLERWFDKFFETYPAEGTKHFKSNPNRFSNPVGQTIKRELETALTLLLEDAGAEELSTPLDSIVRIQAVQEFSTVDSLRFAFQLKDAIRDEVASERAELGEELLAMDHRIDRMALVAFDMYLNCREKIWKIRANEMRKQTAKLLEMVNRRKGSEDE